MIDMAAVADASIDAIFSSHNIEHLYPFEVPLALREFRRVLKPDGFAVITCPDLQSVAALVAEGKLLEPAYVSPAGPISPMDIIYGSRPALAQGKLYMAHRCGFTATVLRELLVAHGFGARVRRRPDYFDLWAVAAVAPTTVERLAQLAAEHFPAGA
jgi:SAM-dependent methyltransferase